MKKIIIIEDSLENKISYYHLAAILITLPFDRFYSQLALVSFLIHTLIHLNKQKLRSAFTAQNLLLSSVFIITAIGILYSQDKDQAIKDIQRQLAIVLFPFSLAACGLNLKKYRANLLMIFSFTCVITIAYLYIDALHIILYNSLPLSRLFNRTFINHNFSEPIQLHATYMAMYALLSASIFTYFLLKETNRVKLVVYFLSVVILLAGLLQLGSRAVLVSALVIVACYPFFLQKRSARLSLFAAMSVTVVLFVLIITNITSFKMRYITWFKDELVQTSINGEIPEPRISRWRLAFQLIGQSPLYGHGSGSEKRLLKAAYFKNKLYISYLHELNAHSQYISFALKTGILGLLIFLFTLFASFASAIRNKDILFGSFLIIISVVSFSENILDVNKGIFFFGLFFSLFMYSGKPFSTFLRFNRQNPSRHASTVSSHNYL